jgi:hypothetical protein
MRVREQIKLNAARLLAERAPKVIDTEVENLRTALQLEANNASTNTTSEEGKKEEVQSDNAERSKVESNDQVKG